MDAQNSTRDTTQKHTPIVFNGKASEYFGIWIVNLLLTLVTFGIYSAWAKVRRKKYFYNNTLIDNVGFDYHAKPMAILKGRVIAFIFFLGYAFGGQFNAFIPIACILIFFIALPWLVVRSSMFNARNTSHRGLRFDFVGKVGEAFRVFFLLPIITMLTLGLFAPFASHQKNKFMMNNHKFGLSQFDMQATGKEFYKVYLRIFIVPILIALIGIIAAIAIPQYQKYVERANAAERAKAANHSALSMPFAMGFVDVQSQVQPQKIVLAENEVAAEMPEAEMKKVERVYSEKMPPEAATPEVIAESQADEDTAQVIAEEAPVATEQPREKTFEEMMQDRQKARAEKMKEMLTHPAAFLAFFVGMLAYLVFVFGIVGYLKARIGNLVWNSATLDKLSFKSSLRARDFIWLYMTNIIAIICTFGLATPWAQIRMAKYRASKLQIVGDVDFDQFVGDKKAEMKATGEEIADFFDVDLSFG